MNDVLRLEGGGQIVDLYPWLSRGVWGAEALAGIVGFGLAPVSARWFDGAGNGSSFRGSRVDRREIDLPLWVYADDRVGLAGMLSSLARCLDAENGQTRLFFAMADGLEWYVDVARTGGGDWKRKQDSDDRTYFKTTLKLEAGDPFWTRVDPESFLVQQDAAAAVSLLPMLANLRLTSSTAFGTQTLVNNGDTNAWPIWNIVGPATSVTLTSAKGEILIWTGTLTAGQSMIIDSRNSTIIDQSGANRYAELATAPSFWNIKPGQSTVTVVASGATSATQILCQWRPRKWAAV